MGIGLPFATKDPQVTLLQDPSLSILRYDRSVFREAIVEPQYY